MGIQSYLTAKVATTINIMSPLLASLLLLCVIGVNAGISCDDYDPNGPNLPAECISDESYYESYETDEGNLYYDDKEGGKRKREVHDRECYFSKTWMMDKIIDQKLAKILG